MSRSHCTKKIGSAQLNATAKKSRLWCLQKAYPLIRATNLARHFTLTQEENIWIVGTAGEADHTLYQSKLTGPLALVMGAEGEGMRRLTREHCDELISIPMAGSSLFIKCLPWQPEFVYLKQCVSVFL